MTNYILRGCTMHTDLPLPPPLLFLPRSGTAMATWLRWPSLQVFMDEGSCRIHNRERDYTTPHHTYSHALEAGPHPVVDCRVVMLTGY